jgi:hypothetical protein
MAVGLFLPSSSPGPPVDIVDRAARLLGRITAPGAGDIADLATIRDLLARGDSSAILQPAAAAGGTLTLANPGAGLRHYVTSIHLMRSATAALAGTASLAITTTNLGALGWKVGNAMAAGGTQLDVSAFWSQGYKSAAQNAASTIVLPAPGAAVLWSLLVTYFVAP